MSYFYTIAVMKQICISLDILSYVAYKIFKCINLQALVIAKNCNKIVYFMFYCCLVDTISFKML